jgi:hypothetical protein
VKGTELLQDVAQLQDQLAVVLLADGNTAESDQNMGALSYEATAAQVTHGRSGDPRAPLLPGCSVPRGGRMASFAGGVGRCPGG